MSAPTFVSPASLRPHKKPGKKMQLAGSMMTQRGALAGPSLRVSTPLAPRAPARLVASAALSHCLFIVTEPGRGPSTVLPTTEALVEGQAASFLLAWTLLPFFSGREGTKSVNLRSRSRRRCEIRGRRR